MNDLREEKSSLETRDSQGRSNKEEKDVMITRKRNRPKANLIMNNEEEDFEEVIEDSKEIDYSEYRKIMNDFKSEFKTVVEPDMPSAPIEPCNMNIHEIMSRNLVKSKTSKKMRNSKQTLQVTYSKTIQDLFLNAKVEAGKLSKSTDYVINSNIHNANEKLLNEVIRKTDFSLRKDYPNNNRVCELIDSYTKIEVGDLPIFKVFEKVVTNFDKYSFLRKSAANEALDQYKLGFENWKDIGPSSINNQGNIKQCDKKDRHVYQNNVLQRLLEIEASGDLRGLKYLKDKHFTKSLIHLLNRNFTKQIFLDTDYVSQVAEVDVKSLDSKRLRNLKKNLGFRKNKYTKKLNEYCNKYLNLSPSNIENSQVESETPKHLWRLLMNTTNMRRSGSSMAEIYNEEAVQKVLENQKELVKSSSALDGVIRVDIGTEHKLDESEILNTSYNAIQEASDVYYKQPLSKSSDSYNHRKTSSSDHVEPKQYSPLTVCMISAEDYDVEVPVISNNNIILLEETASVQRLHPSEDAIENINSDDIEDDPDRTITSYSDNEAPKTVNVPNNISPVVPQPKVPEDTLSSHFSGNVDVQLKKKNIFITKKIPRKKQIKAICSSTTDISLHQSYCNTECTDNSNSPVFNLEVNKRNGSLLINLIRFSRESEKNKHNQIQSITQLRRMSTEKSKRLEVNKGSIDDTSKKSGKKLLNG